MGSDKKRKRSAVESAGSSSSKSKKSKRSMNNTFTISSLKPASSIVIPPIIANSPGIEVPRMKFDVYQRPQPDSTVLLHSASHPRIVYTAKEDPTFLKHYIGVYDEKTGRVDVMEAKRMTIRATPKSQVRQSSDAQNSDTETNKTHQQARENLTREFGGRKAKKAVQSAAENAIRQKDLSLDNTTSRVPTKAEQAMMAAIQDNVKEMPTREEIQAQSIASKPKPPHNEKATEIQDIYKPEDLIGSDILTATPISDWQKAIAAEDKIMTESMFVSERVHAAGNGPDATRRLRVLRYLHYLIIFLKSTRKGRERGTLSLLPREKLTERMAPAPQILIDSLRRKFTDGGVIKKLNLDRIRMYCCAIAANAADFEFNTLSLRHDLNLTENEFRVYFRQIGGKISLVTKDKKKFQQAKLMLPLEFPRESGPRKRKMR